MASSAPTFNLTDDVMTPPQVSVIIPIYNGVGDLPGLEACLLHQTFASSQVEYLLIDNNSTDATAKQLQALSARAQRQGITLIPLSEPHIQSSYAARNRGIVSAQGEILVFTDADCRPEPSWLAAMVQPFEDLKIGLVAGEIKALPGDSLLERYADRKEILSQKFTIAHPFHPYGQTANLAVRRTALEKSGLFRPYLTTGGDADLCWRIQMSGNWQFYFAEAAVVRHRHRSTLRELKGQWQRYGRSNAYLHELHGVSLQPYLSRQQWSRRIARWLVKEVPSVLVRSLTRQATFLDAAMTPLDLFCGRSREVGQRHAKLELDAYQVEWFDTPCSDEVSEALNIKTDSA
ncbi:glycosyltransferase [Oscillatoria sp. CS-180]|uniref:glycosyltransferase n=1 Tax=Oscillatoria sp. CS-180 TaxID=3021720 RepID=UPI00232CC927|nr:glycosyltransferase [Oscillatoria sp. CS-180]MDB9525921.1 glycosyltransferase [Oscillatoria sp. CS-180]